MTATITKLIQKIGKSGKPYQLVCLRREGGGSAVTYVSPSMRNFKEWEPHLKVGVVLENLDLLKDGKTVDADSHPRAVATPEQINLL